MNTTRLATFLAGLRPSAWDADRMAALLNGWTVERRRFGHVVVRDPRFDQLRAQRHHTGQPPPESVRQSVASGRWS
jgi:hypothetical protein